MSNKRSAPRHRRPDAKRRHRTLGTRQPQLWVSEVAFYQEPDPPIDLPANARAVFLSTPRGVGSAWMDKLLQWDGA